MAPAQPLGFLDAEAGRSSPEAGQDLAFVLLFSCLRESESVLLEPCFMVVAPPCWFVSNSPNGAFTVLVVPCCLDLNVVFWSQTTKKE